MPPNSLKSSDQQKKSPAQGRGAFGIPKSGEAKLLVELINTAAGVDQLLLTGEKGVALRADFDLDILFGGAGGDHLSARALDGSLIILRMDTFLHFSSPLSLLFATQDILTHFFSECKTFFFPFLIFPGKTVYLHSGDNLILLSD